ncbi:hypothetical protein [Geodermatophilus ruber]|uniref:Uncharacterized protein n=1 Tax=Geodermatophilus ruber TaxID=504800 RepID=A0A1I4L5U8_9ACTN|nr:hypothetical protein [Geodermatophilus ruber]SFL86415.1 hypothetical protein SAMN04488085_12037 [Geodermatophilus ruber]
MLEFLTVIAVAGLLVLGLLTAAAWLLFQRLRRSRLTTTARTVVAVGPLILATCRPATVRNPVATLRMLRLTRAQRELRRRVGDGVRTGAYLGDVPAMLPRLQAETDRIRIGLGRQPGAATPAGRQLLAAADRHLATLTDLSDAAAATLALPAAEGTLSQEAEEAAHGLRLYAAAYAELTGPTASTVPQRMAG